MVENPHKPLPRVAFWLVPEARTRNLLQQLMRELARQHAGPDFLPHVTLCSCQRSATGGELAILAQHAARCSPLTMQATGLASSGQLTRALYVDLDPDAGVAELHAKLRERVALAPDPCWQPHLSLLYQELSRGERDTLTRSLSCPVATIRFTELWAVAIPAKLHRLDDLLDWRPLLRCRLAQAPGTAKI